MKYVTALIIFYIKMPAVMLDVLLPWERSVKKNSTWIYYNTNEFSASN